jgi:hypothetical protein
MATAMTTAITIETRLRIGSPKSPTAAEQVKMPAANLASEYRPSGGGAVHCMVRRINHNLIVHPATKRTKRIGSP